MFNSLTLPTSSVKSFLPAAEMPANQMEKSNNGLHTFVPTDFTGPINSDFRRVFQTSDQMKTEFIKFLKTIFYRLDEKKVFALMEKILENPEKTDEQIYTELLAQIHTTNKKFPFFAKLWSLSVLKKGLGKQIAQLMKNHRKENFHDYMEIYDRRYVKTIRKVVGLPLNGKVIGVSDNSTVGIGDRVQAGATFSSYPYKQHEPLNEADCQNPLLEPEKTHKPISDIIDNNSVDMIACLGGLHHIPKDRVGPFTDSLHKKLRPGGVILFRDHNVVSNAGAAKLPANDIKAIASVVHSFVNASDGASWEVEKREVREFESLDQWTAFMENHGFTRISKKELVLKDDPTENGMIAFVKNPTNLEELKQAIHYRSDCRRPKEGTRATWIEWGNVRFSTQYAEYIQDHHSYAFDFIGHFKQHWKHFYYFVKESLNDKEIRVKDLLFADGMVMNLFILTAASIQCSIGALTSVPGAMVARWKYGKNWRNVCNLTALEKFEARSEKEYSDFLVHTPFYMFDYIGKMKKMWSTIRNSPESFGVKVLSGTSAAFSSMGLLVKAIVCSPIRSFYTAEANLEPDTIKVLLKDPNFEFNKVASSYSDYKIETIHETPDGYKLVSLPRYRPFTKIIADLSLQTKDLEILEIGSQKEISIDVLADEGSVSPHIDGAKIVYEMNKLQDEEKRRYITYQVNLSALKKFHDVVGRDSVEYIHE